MKATGIVRRIDDLGRVVIPKEIRRTLRIREGDPLEIFTDREGEVILKKYSPIGELSEFANEYAEALYESVGHMAIISDRDTVVAVAGGPKKDYMDQRISSELEKFIESRETYIASGQNKPVRIADPIGAVILVSKDADVDMGDLEVKLAETAAGFLAKQMEH